LIFCLFFLKYQEKDNLVDRKIASLSKYKGHPAKLGVQQRLCTVLAEVRKPMKVNSSQRNESIFYSKQLMMKMREKLREMNMRIGFARLNIFKNYLC